MITVKEFPERKFTDKPEMFKAFRENVDVLIAQKKMNIKECDAVIHFKEETKEAKKGLVTNLDDINELKAELVINSIGLLDSHSDVHIKGIWNKSVKEQKNLYLLQEHKMTFENVISDEVAASVKDINWKDLGVPTDGNTEALVFNANIKKDRNPFMFKQYAKGYVKEHSVGMQYVKYYLALNSDDDYDIQYKSVWDKYIDSVVNKDEAIEQGYFWAVTEAKILEGSAVLKGSNFATPTQSIEAVDDTSKSEPLQDTQSKIDYLTKNFKLK